VLSSLAFCLSLYAEIKIPSIFGDNMLLQRNSNVKIWGKADANAKVDVEFASQKKSTQADANGNWSLRLDKMLANKNPQEMIIFENGKIGKTIKDILVGEVWIAGGQSNMQWRLAKSANGAKYVAQANNPLIRYYNQSTRALSKTPAFDTTNGKWTKPSPKVAGNYSAVGYLFAKKLQKDLDVPVGIIFTALGGSKMIAWIPEENLERLDYTKSVLEGFKKKNATYSYEDALKKWEKDFNDWKKERDSLKAQNKKIKTKLPEKPNELTSIRITFTPSWLYNGIVAPLVNYSVRGVIWYQGEADSGGLFPTEIASPLGYSLQHFSKQMELLIQSWREKFDNPNMPFIQAQLASYMKQHDRDWGRARWEQYQTTKRVPYCYMANLIDCGEEKDIHPKDKTTVANRMCNIALCEVYGKKDIHPYGPEMSSVQYDKDSALVSFNTFGKKLIGKGEPQGFVVRVGKKWTPAKAEFVGDKVKVSSLNGKEISGVRYLWKDWARPNVWLFSEDGLPAVSFTNEKNN
ncbi:MAG: hypothetical protein IKC88_01595, partial [Opitutales bacterium]|nr:hypothetical protein [Opitutales bacterium]